MVRVLVGTDDGLVELGNVGITTTSLGGRQVGAVAGDGSGWWALVDGGEVWHAGGGRTDWQRVAEASPGTRLTCLLAHSDGLLVGTSGAHLLRLDGQGGLERVDAFDHLERRSEWYTPWGGPPDTRSLAGGHRGLFANIHVGGIASSFDEGRSWHQTALDIDSDVHQVLVAPDHPALVLAPCADGLAVSDDRGSSWRVEHDGLHATYARALAVAGDTVVMSASSGPRGERSALYRRPVAGHGPFERCRDGLPEWFGHNIDTGCLVATADAVIAATPVGEVFGSDDQGLTWRQLGGRPSSARCLALAT
jgi:hypothetical protein